MPLVPVCTTTADSSPALSIKLPSQCMMLAAFISNRHQADMATGPTASTSICCTDLQELFWAYSWLRMCEETLSLLMTLCECPSLLMIFEGMHKKI